jgi:hypothetical protein
VPNDNFSLDDVFNELGGASAYISATLVVAFDAADEDGFVGSGRDSLLDFAGYETPETPPPPPTTYQVSLGFASDGAGACTASQNYYWVDDFTFADATKLWTDAGGTILANAGYYSQGEIAGYRYWDGTVFGSPGTTACPGGEEPPSDGGFGF